MPPARVPLEGPFARSVREALETVAAPESAQRVIHAALASAGRLTIPEDAPPFEAFYRGPLRSAVQQMLGQGALEIVNERLAHVLRMAQSQVLPVRAETIAPPVPPRGDDHWDDDSSVRLTPRAIEAGVPAPGKVLLLTVDPLLSVETESRMRTSRVATLTSMNDLLAHLAAPPDRLAIVIDTALPSIDVPTVASLASAIPPGTIVVLWGMNERQKERLVALFPLARGWIASATASSPADLLW